MSDSLSSVRAHSVAKFPVLRFSKAYCSHSSHPMSRNLYRKHVIGENNRLLLSLGIGQILKVYGTTEDKLFQLYCHYPPNYVGFMCQKVKQRVKPPGPLFLPPSRRLCFCFG